MSNWVDEIYQVRDTLRWVDEMGLVYMSFRPISFSWKSNKLLLGFSFGLLELVEYG